MANQRAYGLHVYQVLAMYPGWRGHEVSSRSVGTFEEPVPELRESGNSASVIVTLTVTTWLMGKEKGGQNMGIKIGEHFQCPVCRKVWQYTEAAAREFGGIILTPAQPPKGIRRLTCHGCRGINSRGWEAANQANHSLRASQRAAMK